MHHVFLHAGGVCIQPPCPWHSLNPSLFPFHSDKTFHKVFGSWLQGFSPIQPLKHYWGWPLMLDDKTWCTFCILLHPEGDECDEGPCCVQTLMFLPNNKTTHFVLVLWGKKMWNRYYKLSDKVLPNGDLLTPPTGHVHTPTEYFIGVNLMYFSGLLAAPIKKKNNSGSKFGLFLLQIRFWTLRSNK